MAKRFKAPKRYRAGGSMGQVYVQLIFVLGLTSAWLCNILLGEGGILLAFCAAVLLGGELIRLIFMIFSRKKENPGLSGIGVLISSLFVTAFYTLIFFGGQYAMGLDLPMILTVILLSAVVIRAVLCFLPQNHWSDNYERWAIIRNLPLAVIVFLVCTQFFLWADSGYSFLCPALAASFIINLIWERFARVSKHPAVLCALRGLSFMFVVFGFLVV